MNQSTRGELLRLIDALCEERASRRDCARLEQLVLSDPQACRLYVLAMELHGSLAWDAAGVGSITELPATPSTSASVMAPSGALSGEVTARTPRLESKRSLWRAAGVTVTVAVFLCLAVMFWKPEQPQQIARAPHQPAPPPVESPVAASDETTRQDSAPPIVPDVRLPAHPSNATDNSGSANVTLARDSNARLPALRTDDEVVSFINSRIRQVWEDYDVTPAPPATDDEWLRRVYLDVTGRIPTLSEAESFLANSRSEKREELVDHLLGNRGFSHHLATVWTNLLVGRSQERNIDRFRLHRWLDDEFATGRSWRETVIDLVSARGSAEQNAPANFLLAHLNNEAVPATAITARILLCEQLQCAQCHQHPIVKQWGQERFWELNAFFQQTTIQQHTVVEAETGERRRVRELVDSDDFGPTYYQTLRGVMQVAYPRFAGVELTHQSDEPLRTQLAELLFETDSPQVARAFVNRTWAMLFGYGFTRPVDDMGPHNPPTHPELLSGLTHAFVESGYDVKRLVRWIVLSEAYQRASQTGPGNAIDAPESGNRPLFSRMYLKPLSAEQLHDSLLIAAGTSPARLLSRSVAVERNDWLKQFYTAVDTEENSESTTFDGSLPQALMMMNGSLVEQAISPEQGEVLTDVVRQSAAEVDKIRELSLAALGRYPTREELANLRESLHRSVRQRTEQQVPPQLALAEGLRDLYWAYLNSSEFAVNH